MSETATVALTDFLLARFDEAEKMLSLGMDSAEYLGKRLVDGRAFVKADFEAKRRIVELHEFERGRRDAYRSPRSREIEDEKAAQDRRTQEARSRVAEDVLRLLALPYADHEDFRQEWRP